MQKREKMEIEIRIAENKDIDGIYAVEAASFLSPWSRNSLIAELKSPIAHYVVAEYRGEIVGYGGSWWIVDELHITNISVLPLYRGKGIGKAITGRLIGDGKAAGINNFTLEVRVSNEIAIGMYSFLGFEIEGRRSAYYRPEREDAYIMWRRDAVR